MRKCSKKYRFETMIPRFGGKKALITLIYREIIYCQWQHNIDTYAEIFGGGARLLLNIALPPIAVYNEYDRNICALFKVVQQGGAILDRLVVELRNIAYCKENFDEALKMSEQTDIAEFEQAKCAYILSRWSVLNRWQSFNLHTLNTPERWVKYHRVNLTKERGYYKSISNLYHFHHRLQNVDIICGDFRDALRKYQNCETALIYADPPYTSKDDYDSDWTEKDREELVEMLLNCKCKVILSGYDTPMYNERLADSETMNANGWRRKDLGEFAVASARGKKRHEYLWQNFEGYTVTPVHN